MNNLRNKAIQGASWAVAARLLRTVMGIGTLAVLSRFLSPAEFGIIALVTFVTGFAQLFSDFGTRVALVQRKTITRLEENSVFWSNVGTSFLVMVLIMIFAEPIAGLLGGVEMAGALRWVAPVFLIGSIQGVPLSMLERRMAFPQIAATEVIGALAGMLVAISMVLMGYRLSALIAQQLASPIVTAILFLTLSRWRPALQFSMDALRPLLSYGSYVTGAGVVQFLAVQADRPIIGNRLSPADLGYVAMNVQIVAAPLRIVVQMARKVMFPIMASIQDDDERMRRGLLEMQYGLVVVMAPVCLGLWALADPIVRAILGPGWEMVAAIMGFTTIRALSVVYTDVNAIVFSAKGHAKFQFHWSIFSLAVNVAALLVAVPYGVIALSAARLAVSIVLVPINSWFAVRLIHQPLMDRMAVTVRPILSAVVMAGTVAFVDRVLAETFLLGTVPRLLVGIPLGVVVYLGSELLIDRARFLPYLRHAQALRRAKRR